MAVRIYGGQLPLIQCVNPRRNKWIVLWDQKEEEDDKGISYSAETFYHKPTLQEIKDAINEDINAKVNEEIYSGLIIDGNIVYLSLENQINYQSTYNLACRTNGKNLPKTFKFEDSYKTFNSVEEFQEFFLQVTDHIDACLAKGYSAKQAVDYSEYERLLSSN